MAKLGLDLLSAAFEDVHGHMCLIAVVEVDGRFADRGDFIGGEQTHSINECEIGHKEKVLGAGGWVSGIHGPCNLA